MTPRTSTPGPTAKGAAPDPTVGTRGPPSAVAWSKNEPFRAEFADVRLSSNRLTVEGVAIGSVPVPYRLDCALATVAGFVATQVEVSARGDGRQRSLTLTRLSSRGWTAETQSVGDDVAGFPGTARRIRPSAEVKGG